MWILFKTKRYLELICNMIIINLTIKLSQGYNILLLREILLHKFNY